MLHRIAGLCPVIVQWSEINRNSGEPAKVKPNGALSSFSSSAARFREGVFRKVTGDA